MRTHTSLLLAFLLGVSMLAHCAQAQTDPKSNPATSPPAVDPDSTSWLFPVAKLDEILPYWLHIGGEYRDRVEGPTGIGFMGTSAVCLLDGFRMKLAIQPKAWLKVYGVVQEFRILF